jgi:hypothetical protein
LIFRLIVLSKAFLSIYKSAQFCKHIAATGLALNMCLMYLMCFMRLMCLMCLIKGIDECTQFYKHIAATGLAGISLATLNARCRHTRKGTARVLELLQKKGILPLTALVFCCFLFEHMILFSTVFQGLYLSNTENLFFL